MTTIPLSVDNKIDALSIIMIYTSLTRPIDSLYSHYVSKYIISPST